MTAPTRRGSRATKKKVASYHWFQGDSVRELKARLNAAGEDAILKVYQTGKTMELEVVEPGISAQSHTGAHINDSHACPPDCIPP